VVDEYGAILWKWEEEIASTIQLLMFYRFYTFFELTVYSIKASPYRGGLINTNMPSQVEFSNLLYISVFFSFLLFLPNQDYDT
jgi:hypothetical protein